MHQTLRKQANYTLGGLICHGKTGTSQETSNASSNLNLCAPEQDNSTGRPFCCVSCHLWLRSLTSLTVTDKMSMWMYANVIFVVHYSLKDRSWTISFPFMRLSCWPAEWRYSNYSFLYTGGAFSEAAPLPSVKEKLAYRWTAGEELSSYNETSAILVKQKDAGAAGMFNVRSISCRSSPLWICLNWT